MRKFFFFGSSAAGNIKDNVGPPLPTDKKADSEHPLKTGLKGEVVVDGTESKCRNSKHLVSKARKQSNKIKSSSIGSSLRRSRSLSSAAFLGTGRGLGDESRSPPCCKSSASRQHYDQSSRYWILIPAEHYDGKQCEVPKSQYTAGLEKLECAPSQIPNDSSGNSSTSSGNNSSKIVDRYIDGDQQQSFSSRRHFMADGNDLGIPPRVQTRASTSPTNSVKVEARSHFLCISYEEWTKKRKFEHESPRSIAKNVERLSQNCLYPKSNPSAIGPRISQWNECHQTDNVYDPKDYSGFDRKNLRDCEGFSHVETDDCIDELLFQRAVEAEERIVFHSQDLEQENFHQEGGLSVPGLIKTIRSLIAERISLAREVLGLLQSQIAERASFKERLRIAKVELESQSHKLEKEKSEFQLGLEKEIDRRSSNWSFKLEKYQREEHRLREKVKELAEQNLSFQKEFSSLNARETESRRVISYSEQKLKDLTSTSDAMREENQHLNQNLSELQEYCRAATEANNKLHNLFEEKEKECKKSHKSITILLRKCCEHERTISVLRERFNDDIWKNKSEQKLDENVVILQMELMRLTGFESALRRELEFHSIEIDSLRHENTNLMNYLHDKGKDNGALTLKLDKEILSRIYCLQHQGISVLNESSQICSKMLEFIKEPKLEAPNQEVEIIKGSLDGQFVLESEMKLQGLKRGTESLTRNLQLVSNVLHEKSNLAALTDNSNDLDTHGLKQLNDEHSEHNLRYELKAESLLTSLLREKLHSKRLEADQLHAELATAVRGTDILRNEVQIAMATISTITHRLKDLELQILKKDESINQLQNDLKNSTEKVAKKYREKNTRLSSEVDLLRKKIEEFEEDVLLKEGQITILKDTIMNKPF